MRILVVGDIHGGLRALEQVLQRAKVSPKDMLIFLGDYVDGWSHAVETVNFLMKLRRTNNCIFLRGNHDALCYDWLTTQQDNPLWLQHGGRATMASYIAWDRKLWQEHQLFYETLENYYLDNTGRLFLHAGFTNLKGVEWEYFSSNFYWDRTLWELALSLDPELRKEDAHFPKRLAAYNEIYIGHTPVTRIGKTMPYKAANVWNIDTGAAFKGPLSIIDVQTKQVWQSDPVFQLYPGENGRN